MSDQRASGVVRRILCGLCVICASALAHPGFSAEYNAAEAKRCSARGPNCSYLDSCDGRGTYRCYCGKTAPICRTDELGRNGLLVDAVRERFPHLSAHVVAAERSAEVSSLP
jgi:hypothetical protein